MKAENQTPARLKHALDLGQRAVNLQQIEMNQRVQAECAGQTARCHRQRHHIALQPWNFAIPLLGFSQTAMREVEPENVGMKLPHIGRNMPGTASQVSDSAEIATTLGKTP